MLCSCHSHTSPKFSRINKTAFWRAPSWNLASYWSDAQSIQSNGAGTSNRIPSIQSNNIPGNDAGHSSPIASLDGPKSLGRIWCLPVQIACLWPGSNNWAWGSPWWWPEASWSPEGGDGSLWPVVERRGIGPWRNPVEAQCSCSRISRSAAGNPCQARWREGRKNEGSAKWERTAQIQRELTSSQ